MSNSTVTVVLEDSVVLLNVVHNSENDTFDTTLSDTEGLRFGEESFSRNEFQQFVKTFSGTFSIGLATVEMRNRTTYAAFRTYLRNIAAKHDIDLTLKE